MAARDSAGFLTGLGSIRMNLYPGMLHRETDFFRPGYLEEEALLMEKSTNRGFPLFIYLDGEGTETHGTSREMAEKLMEFLETADFTPESGLRNMVVRISLSFW